ncbi:MAG: isopentenyl transferase family protein [bacterium]|nr:isopentenyl transferase family protein [bacterium]
MAMKYNAAIVIIGPTGVGKTAVAFELARRAGNGEVINLDTTFLFRHFPIGTGLADALKEKGVKKHLYELLEPDEAVIPAATYAGMVRDTCAKILLGEGLPIIEGGSTTFFPALFDLNSEAKFCQSLIGLTPAPGFDLKENIIRRVNAMLEKGLLDEIREGLKKYRDSFIMKTAYCTTPLVPYLEGSVTLEQAKEKIVQGCLVYAERQLNVFRQYFGITWLEHEPAKLSQTVSKILSLMST